MTLYLYPLPGASYHTIDNIHNFSSSSSEKSSTSDEQPVPARLSPLRNRRGPPVLLILISFCCLTFVVSAFTGHTLNHLPLPQVPDRHERLAGQVSTSFRTQPYGTWVKENHDGALDILQQKYNPSHTRCHNPNLREYIQRTFSLVNSSLDWTYVSQSAVIIRWQGADPSSKPVLFTNSDRVLDVGRQGLSTAPRHAQVSELEHLEELADVETAVGMLTAAEVLVRFGHQPARTLLLGLMLGEASDAPKVSEYLHSIYGEHVLGTGFEPPAPEFKKGRLPRLLQGFRAFFCRAFRQLPISISIPLQSEQATPIGGDEPRLFRYIFSVHNDQAIITDLRVQAINVWARLILGADGEML